MNERRRLTEEIRAAREEKVRRERQEGSSGRGGIAPPTDPAFYRLRTLSLEALTDHIERLERDLKHLDQDPEIWDDDLGSNK